MRSADQKRIFYYRATSTEGTLTTGQMEAVSKDMAVFTLRRAGYRPLRIDDKPLNASWLHREITPARSAQLRLAEAEDFCRQLGILLTAGVELLDALSVMLPSLKKSGRSARFVLALMQGLKLGNGLSRGAELSGFHLPADFVRVLRAGEETASLPQVLQSMAEAYRDAATFWRSFVGALLYPAFLLFTAFAAVAVIGFFVAPNLVTLFEGMGRQPPLTISVLSGLADWLTQHTVLAGTVGVAAAAGMLLAASRPRIRQVFIAFLFRLPGIGPALSWQSTQRFATTLKLYLSANVPMASAVAGAIDASGFPHSTQHKSRVTAKLRGGGKLSSALAEIGALPSRAIHLAAVGENSGKLDEVLNALIHDARVAVDQRLAIMSSLLAPVLILTVGVVAGTIIYSVFSAMLEMNELAF